MLFDVMNVGKSLNEVNCKWKNKVGGSSKFCVVKMMWKQ